MLRRWFRVMAGLGAIAGVGVGGCGQSRMLEPGAKPPRGDGGGVGLGGHVGGGGVTPAPSDTTSLDGSAAGAGGGSPAMDARGITTWPPTSMCAQSVGRLPGSANATDIPSCGGSLPIMDSMTVGPAPIGQSYVRCGTLGPETSWRVTLSRDGGHLAARTSAGTVRLYRTADWQEIAQLASAVGSMDAVAFSPDGTRLATLSSELGQLTIWNVGDGGRTATFEAPPISTLGYPSSALAFSSDGRRIATSLGRVVDLQNGTMTTFQGQPVRPYSTPINPAGADLPMASTYSLRFVGCDQRLLVDAASPAGMNGWVEHVSLVDPVSGTETVLAGGLWAQLGNIVASPDGRWVALTQQGDGKKGLHLYDAASGTEVAFDPKPPRLVAGFSRYGNQLFILTDTSIEVRDVPTLRWLNQAPLPAGTITAAVVSPGGDVLVSNDNASMWVEPNNGVIHRREPFPVTSAEFSGDGRFGVAAGAGATLFHLWREADPWGPADRSVSCAPAAAPPEAAISRFAVSRDARTLALVDRAGVVQLRAVDPTGGVGPPWATLETGAMSREVDLASGVDIAAAVTNGGGRVAVQGPVPASSGPGLTSRLVVFDTTDRKPLLVRDVPRSRGPLALSPDGAWVAFQDGDYLGDGQSVALSIDSGATALSVPAGQIDSFSPDSTRLAVVSGGLTQVWDLTAGAEATTYSLPDLWMQDVALSPDWSMIGGWTSPIPYQPDMDNTLVWHPQDGSVVQKLGDFQDVVAAPRFDTANGIVAMNLFTGHTLSTSWSAWYVWSVADGTTLRVFPMSRAPDEPLVVLPGGHRLLTRAGTGVAVWCR